MPAGVQAKLLRALEAGEVRRIGENDVRSVDVRFVAATNADLQAAVDAGSFRSDLFYRLNVHHIHLPPLRERPGDVELLLDFFMERVGPPAGVTGFSDEARAALLAFDYPGNVRQLEHVIQRAVAVARGQLVETVDLPEELFAGADRGSAERRRRQHRRRGARARRARDDRRHAGAQPRRGLRHRARAASEPDHALAAHEETPDLKRPPFHA